MRLPHHNPNCKTLTIDRSECIRCGKTVFFWACTCGKQVFLESGVSGWILHKCYNSLREREQKLPVIPKNVIRLEGPPANPLVECRFCGKKMKGKSLYGHIKRQHRTKSTFNPQRIVTQASNLDGVEIQSTKLIQEIKTQVIDEGGFLVSPDMVIEKITDLNSEKLFHPSESVHPKVQPNIFEEIKSGDLRIPGSRKKKYPRPDEQVRCPICNKALLYIGLFDHVSNKHKDQIAKSVLAKFNRKYEEMANK